jgi:hypothetical protein
MNRTQIAVASLLTACVPGWVGAASAVATSTNNPQWSLCSKVAGTGHYTEEKCATVSGGNTGNYEATKLTTGNTAEVTAAANGVQGLGSSGGIAIVCKEVNFVSGAELIGSNAPNAGTSEEEARLSGCEEVGYPLCKVEGPAPGEVHTKLLTGKLVFLTKAAAEKEEASGTGIVFVPKTAGVFAEYKLKETTVGTGECLATGTITTSGTLVVKNLSPTAYAPAPEVEAPTTAINSYFINESGTTVEKKASLSALGVTVLYTGKIKLSLVSGYFWSVFN